MANDRTGRVSWQRAGLRVTGHGVRRLAVVGGGGGEVAGEGAPVGAFGFELGFGAFGAGAFGTGERLGCGELGCVMFAEGVAFAGGVIADVPGFGAGVGFGLAGAADLGVGGVPGLACGGERVVAFACVTVGVRAGRGGASRV